MGLKYKLMENQDECCYYGWGTQKFSGVINMKQYKISSSRPKLMQYDDRVLGVERQTLPEKMVLDHFQPKLHNGEQNMTKLKSLGTGTVAA
jgi:hypothetical protein